MTQYKRGIGAAKARIELENLSKSRDRTRFFQSARWRVIGHEIQARRSGQHALLHRQDAKDGFDDTRRPERVAEHAFSAADRRTALAEHGTQGRSFHRIIVAGAGSVGMNKVNLLRLHARHAQSHAYGLRQTRAIAGWAGHVIGVVAAAPAANVYGSTIQTCGAHQHHGCPSLARA